jgi:ssDNA-binding Zn-finger/Zn-ribbon topoisomerase 1
MKRKILLPFAVRGETLVHVSEVTSGRQFDCLCPACHKSLIARKGAKVTHHFAHDAGSTCSVETALHSLAKRLIHDGIQRALSAGESVRLRWKCNECQDEHEGNLLKQAKGVRLEHDLGEARPDVLLFGAGNQPIVAVEIVVTHPPEAEVRDFYERKGITLVQVRIPDASFLESLRDLKELPAYEVTLCLRKKCPDCKKPLANRSLVIVVSDCYRCGRPMKIAFLDCEGVALGPEAFTPSDITAAKSHGCILEQRFSKTVERSYLANVCPNCSAFVGEHFMHDHWHAPQEAVVPAGNHCFDCGRNFVP